MRFARRKASSIPMGNQKQVGMFPQQSRQELVFSNFRSLLDFSVPICLLKNLQRTKKNASRKPKCVVPEGEMLEGPEGEDEAGAEAREDSIAAERGSMVEGDIEEGSGLRERIRRSERENRRLRHDSNERKTVEEVFDKATNFALNELMSRGEIAYLNGVVRAGKEARVYG